MTKENITTVIITLAAILSAVITLLWPTQAGTYGELLKIVVAALLAIVAVLYPSGKAISQIYKARMQASYYEAVRSGKLDVPKGDTAIEDVQPQIDAVIQSIKSDLTSDGIPYKTLQGDDDPVPMAPRIVQKLANCWGDQTVSLAFKMVLLQKAISIASQSFTMVTTLPAPTNWVEVASPQSYWATHQVGCAVHSEGLFHQVLMPIRKVLQIRDTGTV